MALKIIKCPWCGKEARITYEENRVYQMKCYSCHNTMLHVDRSFDRAAEFFEHHAKLLQADKDGRLVVLPCKVGDRVWVTRAYGKQFDAPRDGYVRKFVVHDDELVFLEALIWIDLGEGKKEYGYRTESFGKIVHLTREEAEAELKGGES